MFPLVSALSSINFFDLRSASPANNGAETPFMKQAVAATSFSPNHPKHSDSAGVSGESSLARRLDFIA